MGKDSVRRARKATGAFAPVEKRIGKDGIPRRQPKAREPVPSETLSAIAESRRQGKSQVEAAKDAGFASRDAAKIADGYERGQSDLLEQLDIDPETLASWLTLARISEIENAGVARTRLLLRCPGGPNNNPRRAKIAICR